MTTIRKCFRAVAGIALCGGLAGWSLPGWAGTEPFLGEIAFVGFNFAPRGWAFCDGQVMSIAQNTALFSLLGTTYGGDGITTFALPDLRGRLPMHYGQGPGLTGHDLGQPGGAETVTLDASQLPSHSHAATTAVGLGSVRLRGTSAAAASDNPANNLLASTQGLTYGTGAPMVKMSASSLTGKPNAATTIAPAGDDQPVQIMPPFLPLNCIIAVEGIFPSRQ